MPETLKPDELVRELRNHADDCDRLSMPEGRPALARKAASLIADQKWTIDAMVRVADADEVEIEQLKARATTAEAALVKARTALLGEVISLIEDDMFGPVEAEAVPELMAFNKALKRQINRITSRLIVAPEAAREALKTGEDNG